MVTPAVGEIGSDTTNSRVILGDGATAGGISMAKLSEVVTRSRTAVSDTNYTALITDRLIAYTTLTAARTVSLPQASTFPTGTRLLVIDESNNASPLVTITLSPYAGDSIIGRFTIRSAGCSVEIESNGGTQWTVTENSSVQSSAVIAQGVNGASIQAAILETSVTLSGASTNASVQIPANCIVLSVGAYVVTTITGATSYEVGVAGNLSQFGSGLSLPAGSSNFGLIGPTAFYSATTLTVTAAGSNFTGGVVRLSIHYLVCNPSTS
jgi:hypothetical protein